MAAGVGPRSPALSRAWHGHEGYGIKRGFARKPTEEIERTRFRSRWFSIWPTGGALNLSHSPAQPKRWRGWVNRSGRSRAERQACGITKGPRSVADRLTWRVVTPQACQRQGNRRSEGASSKAMIPLRSQRVAIREGQGALHACPPRNSGRGGTRRARSRKSLRPRPGSDLVVESGRKGEGAERADGRAARGPPTGGGGGGGGGGDVTKSSSPPREDSSRTLRKERMALRFQLVDRIDDW